MLIEQLGANGYPFARIARELNMTPSELMDEVERNEDLKRSIDRAEFNKDMFRLSEIEEAGIGNVRTSAQLDEIMFIRQKHSKTTDNEIIVRRV